MAISMLLMCPIDDYYIRRQQGISHEKFGFKIIHKKMLLRDCMKLLTYVKH